MPEAVKKTFARGSINEAGDFGDSRIVGHDGARAQDEALSKVCFLREVMDTRARTRRVRSHAELSANQSRGEPSKLSPPRTACRSDLLTDCAQRNHSRHGYGLAVNDEWCELPLHESLLQKRRVFVEGVDFDHLALFVDEV
jgi:hypothetical protein